MVDLYTAVFLALLLVYMGYSVWDRLDPRYPVAGALVLLIGAAVADAAGFLSLANTLALYVFYLLGAGVLLLLIDHVRTTRAEARSVRAVEPPAQGGQAADQGNGPT